MKGRTSIPLRAASSTSGSIAAQSLSSAAGLVDARQCMMVRSVPTLASPMRSSVRGVEWRLRHDAVERAGAFAAVALVAPTSAQSAAIAAAAAVGRWRVLGSWAVRSSGFVVVLALNTARAVEVAVPSPSQLPSKQ